MNYKSYKSITMPVIIFSTIVALGACGGGSVSTGGSGSPTTQSAANLVVKVDDGSRSAQLQDIQYGSRGLAATVVDLLISRAEAQVGGVLVTVWEAGSEIARGTTDEFGEVGFVVDPALGGTYTVCIGEGMVNCALVTDDITNEDVLIATVDNSTGTPTITGVSEPRADNIALFEDTDHTGPNTKIVLCHKPDSARETISVSENAVDAHLKHGDIPGACSDSGVATAGNQSGGTGKPDHAGKPAPAG